MDIGVIPGDGIGPEVVREALRVLSAVRQDIRTTTYDFGAARYHRTNEILPDDALVNLCRHDALLLGAIGDPSVPSGVLERGLLLKLRFALDHHVNLRPCRLYPASASSAHGADQVDFLVVREGTEGPYTGAGGAIRAETPREVATEISINTRYGVERVVRYAFEAAERRRRRVTLIHKTNVLKYAGSLWARTVDDVASDHPGIAVSYLHVDAATIHLMNDPSEFDVIVTDNLFGDIISDLAAAITGGIGLAASGNIDSSGDNPSMFEPVHGSAPDIAGKGVADPTAAILSAALMLRHLGDAAGADRIEAAVAADLVERALNGAHRSTEQVGTSILSAVER